MKIQSRTVRCDVVLFSSRVERDVVKEAVGSWCSQTGETESNYRPSSELRQLVRHCVGLSVGVFVLQFFSA